LDLFYNSLTHKRVTISYPIYLFKMKKKNILTSLERTKFTLTDQLKQILVGLLLGDLYAQKRRKTGNTVFRFEQGTVH
jgi:hypothetical protein